MECEYMVWLKRLVKLESPSERQHIACEHLKNRIRKMRGYSVRRVYGGYAYYPSLNSDGSYAL